MVIIVERKIKNTKNEFIKYLLYIFIKNKNYNYFNNKLKILFIYLNKKYQK